MKKFASAIKKVILSPWFKYGVVCVVFVLAMVFSTRHNLIQNFKNRRTINQLETEKAYYENKIIQDSERLNELKSDKQDLEKFARERYLLKKPNEDVFVVSPN